MARWLSSIAEYKIGKPNAPADALSRRPDYKVSHVKTLSPSISYTSRAAYVRDHHHRFAMRSSKQGVYRLGLKIVSTIACATFIDIVSSRLYSIASFMRHLVRRWEVISVVNRYFTPWVRVIGGLNSLSGWVLTCARAIHANGSNPLHNQLQHWSS